MQPTTVANDPEGDTMYSPSAATSTKGPPT